MTPIKTSVILLFCAFIFVLSNCKKKESQVVEDAPVVKAPLLQADTEIRTSMEVTFANRVVSDFILMIGHSSIFYSLPVFFQNIPSSSTSTVDNLIINDTVGKKVTVVNKQAKCFDGLIRDGSIQFNYQPSPASYPNNAIGANYFHQYGFACKLSFTGYKVGDYLINNSDPNNPAIIYNNLTVSQPDYKTTKLSWTLRGKFSFTHLVSPSKNMTWEGELTVTLDNSDSPTIFTNSVLKNIVWPNAKLSFKGTSNGIVSQSNTYTFTIDNNHPLRKDFVCSTPIVFELAPNEKHKNHPFVDGLATISLSSSTKTRSIFFGNTDFSFPPCNNSGLVFVESTPIPIEFK